MERDRRSIVGNLLPMGPELGLGPGPITTLCSSR
jgi:hypothetical protein